MNKTSYSTLESSEQIGSRFRSIRIEPSPPPGCPGDGFPRSVPDTGGSDSTALEGSRPDWPSPDRVWQDSGLCVANAAEGPHALPRDSRPGTCSNQELAVQVAGEFERLAKHLPSRTMPIYGGASMR